LEKGGKGGFIKLINLPKDTPLSLRRGVFIGILEFVVKKLQTNGNNFATISLIG
jgi:hypothetical protein